ncbi:hypothetical protein FRC10_008195 [Ceratobasidium sp. 414]|nr:hypothetical protein FRC10_008195 [Ceratobasidium sp. 414]
MAEVAPPPQIPGQTFIPPTAQPNAMEVDGVAAPAAAAPVPAMDPVTGLPLEASETLYIQNLNEKINIEQMKSTLRSLFKGYGKILDVVAHGNLRMRGQAFVSFESKEIAAKALKEVKNFPLYAKPMQISFAKSRSDAVVKTLDQEHFEQHHAARVAKKPTNPSATAPAPRRAAVQMPDEYLPPNKILFLQNLPIDVHRDQLMALFGQYPGLSDVRMIPTKKDIAFVEFVDEATATVAKDALHNYKLDGEGKIKITFARK